MREPIILPLALALVLLAACSGTTAAPTSRTENAASGAPAAASAPPGAAAAAPREFVIGTAGFTAFNWGIYVAEALDWYSDNDLAVEWLVTESPPKTAQVLASGDVQLGTIGTDFIISAIEQGADLAMVGAEMRAPLLSLMVGPDIRDWSDLRGKAIAVSGPQVAEALYARKLLALRGVDPDSVDLVSAGSTPERFAALRSGALSAAMLTQPQDLQAVSLGFRRLGDSTEVIDDYPFPSYAVRRGWATANEDTLVAFLRATRRGHDWLYDPANADRAVAILVERTRTEEPLARQTYDLLVREKRLIAPGAVRTTAGVANVLALMAEQGRLTPPLPPADKYLAPQFLARAAGAAR